MQIDRSVKLAMFVAGFGLCFSAGFVLSTWPPRQGTGQQAESESAEVTFVGCLVRIDTGAWRPGTTDTVPAGSGRSTLSSGYALKDAAVASIAPNAAGPIDTRSGREFGVQKGDVKVDRFAGHQVEIKGRLTGSIESPGRDTLAAVEVGTSGGDRDPAAPDGARRSNSGRIAVTAIRSLSDTCPPAR
jgi:hypothetical protein